MRPLRRQTRLEKAMKAARNVPSAVGSALNDRQPPKAVKSGVTAVAAVTATSAVISAVRRRIEGPSDR
jgi:hypothetical protein